MYFRSTYTDIYIKGRNIVSILNFLNVYCLTLIQEFWDTHLTCRNRYRRPVPQADWTSCSPLSRLDRSRSSCWPRCLAYPFLNAHSFLRDTH